MNILKLLRIHHWIKNGLIFLPLVFSGKLFDGEVLLRAVCGFFVFSFFASAIYILNDICDCENDKNHPVKCNRPIASGAVSKKNAWMLLAGSLTASAVVNCFAPMTLISWGFAGAYFLLNFGYSVGLKHIPIVDVAILVSGFVLRVLYGSSVTGLEVSKWLYLTIISMSFYLGLGKRRNEMQKQFDNTREVLKYYNHAFLDKNMYMCLALTIVFYSLWTVDPITLAKHSSGNLVWTVPLIILICMKYSLSIEGDSDGDPVEVILQDRSLLLLLVAYAAIAFFIIYGPKVL